MIFLIQECLKASVTVDDKEVSKIDKGFVIFVGFTLSDNKTIVDKMIDKLLKARIFPDDRGLTNLSIKDIDGQILAVSQFTLYTSLKEGNRPSFTNALRKEESVILYDYFKDEISKKYPRCEFGIFHADMKVSLINDGPFTIILDSKEVIK